MRRVAGALRGRPAAGEHHAYLSAWWLLFTANPDSRVHVGCLLDDGYFSFTDKSREYSSVPWFDEYDHKLGRALSGPPTASWSQDIWRRDFQNGVALVNPTTSAKTVKIEPGLHRLTGNQDPTVNNGSAVSQVTLQPKDGIVLLRQVAIQESPR